MIRRWESCAKLPSNSVRWFCVTERARDMSGITQVAFCELRTGDVLEDGSIVLSESPMVCEDNGAFRSVFVRSSDNGVVREIDGYMHERVKLSRPRGVLDWEHVCVHDIKDGDRILIGHGRVCFVTSCFKLDNGQYAILFFDDLSDVDGIKRAGYRSMMRATLT